jgi:hypothetical protein
MTRTSRFALALGAALALGVGLALGALLAATRAGASIPVDLEDRSRDNLRHVCVDVEPTAPNYIACVEQDKLTGVYSGAECTVAGLPPTCSVDFVGKLRFKGKLLLIQDDQAKDTLNTPRPVTGVVLEIGVRGKKVTLIDLFDGTEIGHWNAFAEAFLLDLADTIEFTNDDRSAFTFPSDNLEDLGLELRTLAEGAWPTVDFSQATAVFTSVVRDSPKKLVDHADVADPLGSAASFKVTIAFARVRP